MHNFKLTWLLLSTLRFQLVLEQERRVSTSGALFFSFIIFFFATFLVSTSNPFLKVPFPSLISLAELNPVLQDPVLAIHPPCIYAGYVASAICFSMSLAYVGTYSSSNYNQYRLLNFSFERARIGLVNKSRCEALQLPKHLHLQPYSILRQVSSKKLRKQKHQGLSFPNHHQIKSDIYPIREYNKSTKAASLSSLGFLQKLTNERFPRNQWLLQPINTLFCDIKRRATFNMFNLIKVWMLASWSLLTFGILLGSWWAYHELGWGGWWFWDPVENASLMPWLLATACIHMSKDSDGSKVTLYFGTFVLSILGTFFVRSGLLASVHSFATDSTRGIYLFLFLLCISLLSLIKIIQIQRYFSKGCFATFRTQLDQILSLQNFFFCVICFVVFCGTSAPLIFLWFWNRDLSTGAPFYNGTLVPLFTSLFFMLAYTHYAQLRFFSKKKLHHGNNKFTYDDFITRVRNSLDKNSLIQRAHKSNLNNTKISWPKLYFDSLFAKATMFYMKFLYPILKPIKISPKTINTPILSCIILCFFLNFICLNAKGLSILDSIYGTLCILLISIFLLKQTNKKKASLLNTKIQSKNQPSRLIAFFQQVALAKGKGTLAMVTAHIGIIIFITGIILSNTFKSQFTQLMHYGSLIRIGSEYCCLRSIDHAYAPTYHSICGNLLVTKPADLASSKRFFPSEPSGYLCMFPEKRFF